MNFFTKTRLLVGVIVLLLALNIGTWLSVGYFRVVQTTEPDTVGQRMHPGRFMAQELNLTHDQELLIDSLRADFHSQISPLRSEIRAQYHGMMNEIGSEQPDRQRLDSFAETIGNLHHLHQQVTIDHFLQVRGVCTPEQRIKLKGLYQRMSPKGDRMHRGEGMFNRRARRRDTTDRPRGTRRGGWTE